MPNTPRPMCRAARDLLLEARRQLVVADVALGTATKAFRSGQAVVGVLDLADGRAALAAARALITDALRCAPERTER